VVLLNEENYFHNGAKKNDVVFFVSGVADMNVCMQEVLTGV
jgi:hypothetical protein